MNKSGQIGTKAESAVVKVLTANGFPERILAKRQWTETGCLEFMGARTDRGGYGKAVIGSRRDGSRRIVRVSRLAWITMHGEIPDGQIVCHRCDNPPCFNPDHLFLGAPVDNTADMIAKGRARHTAHRGASNGRTRLAEEEVRKIRALAASGRSCRSIAREFSVGAGTVSAIVRRVNWRWLP